MDALTKEPLHEGIIINTNTNNTILFKNGKVEITANELDSLRVHVVGYVEKCFLASQLPPVIALDHAPELLAPVVVTANREASKRADAPIAIKRLNAKVIDETKASSIYELITKIPGVNMVNLGQEQHMMSIRQPITTNAYFLYLEDGIPIRPLGVFNHNALLELNQFNLSALEVVKGPVSSIYGADAIGGTINFITSKGSAVPTVKLGVQLDQWGYKRTHIGAGAQLGKWSVYVGGLYSEQTNSWLTFSDYKKQSYTARLDYQLSSKTRFTLASTLNDYYSDMTGSVDSLAFYTKSYTSTTDFTYRSSKAMRSRLSMEHAWNEKAKTSITVFQRTNELGQNPNYAIRWNAKSPVAAGQINLNSFQSYGALVQHSQSFAFLKSALIVGATYDYSPTTYWAYQVDLFAQLRPDSLSVLKYIVHRERPEVRLVDYRAIIQNSATYFQYLMEPVKHLKVSFGGRFDVMMFAYDNRLGKVSGEKAYTNFTPKIGVTYTVKKQSGMYANYAQGFSPPGLTAIFRPKPATNPVDFYYNLKPAYFDNYEAGFWVALAKQKILLDVSIYTMNGRNELLGIKQADNSTDYQSAGKTLHKGIEFNLAASPFKSIAFRFGGTYAKHQFVDFKVSEKASDAIKNFNGFNMPGAPKWVWNSELSYYPTAIKNLRLSLEWQHVSAYFQNQINTVSYKGYDLVNARIGYRIKMVEVFSNLFNVFDALYATNVTRGNRASDRSTFTPAAPRTIVCGIQLDFTGKK
jgi:iron complex outermembrane receptor protein